MNTDDLTGGSAGAVTVWQYFASYVPYWLEQTGLPAGSSLAEQATKGIDGLRADFGQGMPPQFREYCINVARAHKWSFVFMTESLDGGAVTYRSNRHFEVLNENIVFPWQEASTTGAHRQIFEDRRTAYGQGLVLLNNTSHDEAGYADPWQAFIRYAVGSTIDGAPMIMYGQEIGTSDLLSFDNYELNFGKWIPHFKSWNSMQPQWTAWGANSFGARNLFPAYSGVGKARESSPALRSSNRWFLNPVGSGDPSRTHLRGGEIRGRQGAPAAVVCVRRQKDPQRNAFSSTGRAHLLGLASGRHYNVRNISAYLGPDNEYPTRRDTFLWGTEGRTREQIIANGVSVSMFPVPGTDEAWGFAPFEAQYLRVYDVTTPPAVAGAPETSVPVTVDGTVSLSWNPVVDPAGLVPVYQVAIRDAQGNVIHTITTTSTAVEIEDLPEGASYTFAVTSANPNDQSKTAATSPVSAPVFSLAAAGDHDGDGMKNDRGVAGRHRSAFPSLRAARRREPLRCECGGHMGRGARPDLQGPIAGQSCLRNMDRCCNRTHRGAACRALRPGLQVLPRGGGVGPQGINAAAISSARRRPRSVRRTRGPWSSRRPSARRLATRSWLAARRAGSTPAFMRSPKAISSASRVAAGRISSLVRGRTAACTART